ncbi:hypothetical protein C8039_07365 [Halogeometricum sp. wsp3]|nr:hypothetical protein C8039_07365 [Halogeometricum sp. wsp3]
MGIRTLHVWRPRSTDQSDDSLRGRRLRSQNTFLPAREKPRRSTAPQSSLHDVSIGTGAQRTAVGLVLSFGCAGAC